MIHRDLGTARLTYPTRVPLSSVDPMRYARLGQAVSDLAQITTVAGPSAAVAAGAQFTLQVTAQNVGGVPWTTAYMVIAQAPPGAGVAAPQILATLPSAVAPGQAITVTLTGTAPPQAGTYAYTVGLYNPAGQAISQLLTTGLMVSATVGGAQQIIYNPATGQYYNPATGQTTLTPPAGTAAGLIYNPVTGQYYNPTTGQYSTMPGAALYPPSYYSVPGAAPSGGVSLMPAPAPTPWSQNPLVLFGGGLAAAFAFMWLARRR